MKHAPSEIRSGKISNSQIGFVKIGIANGAFMKNGTFQIKTREIGRANQAFCKSERKKHPVALGKIDTDKFATGKFHVLQSAAIEFDKAKVTVDQLAFEKLGAGKIALRKIAAFKRTPGKTFVLEIQTGKGTLFKCLVFKLIFGKQWKTLIH